MKMPAAQLYVTQINTCQKYSYASVPFRNRTNAAPACNVPKMNPEQMFHEKHHHIAGDYSHAAAERKKEQIQATKRTNRQSELPNISLRVCICANTRRTCISLNNDSPSDFPACVCFDSGGKSGGDENPLAQLLWTARH